MTLKDDGFITIAMTSNLSNRLQPLDVSGFQSFKCHFKKVFHLMSREETALSVLNVFRGGL